MNGFKAMRVKNDLTQNELADILGIGQSAISAWEQGISKPRVDILIRLSELCHCSVDDLLKPDCAQDEELDNKSA